MTPFSKGRITLQSTDPLQQPNIDPNYLSDPKDAKMMVQAFRTAKKIANTTVFRKFGAKQKFLYDECNRKTGDDLYDCLVRMETLTSYHPCCTAKIGNEKDNLAVVDPRLRVYKVKGLRIADASVMPAITSANIQAPCYMIGEKAAHMLKEDWRL
uniref:Glucose-methanol-choline oxidoreductase C-terminal domain-containing protein n=1 Tax=Ciona intestinalis TaxID=7719 RepID=F6YTI0_CIOIN